VLAPYTRYKHSDVQTQLRQYRDFLQYNDGKFPTGLGDGGGRYRVSRVEGKILVTVEFVFGIIIVGVGAIVTRTSEGPDIARIVENAVGVVVFRCGGGKVELD
jgi:hypothetical protein